MKEEQDSEVFEEGTRFLDMPEAKMDQTLFVMSDDREVVRATGMQVWQKVFGPYIDAYRQYAEKAKSAALERACSQTLSVCPVYASPLQCGFYCELGRRTGCTAPSNVSAVTNSVYVAADLELLFGFLYDCVFWNALQVPESKSVALIRAYNSARSILYSNLLKQNGDMENFPLTAEGHSRFTIAFAVYTVKRINLLERVLWEWLDLGKSHGIPLASVLSPNFPVSAKKLSELEQPRFMDAMNKYVRMFNSIVRSDVIVKKYRSAGRRVPESPVQPRGYFDPLPVPAGLSAQKLYEQGILNYAWPALILQTREFLGNEYSRKVEAAMKKKARKKTKK